MPDNSENNPLQWFHQWYQETLTSKEPEPTAMSVATIDEKGQPTVRIVLLKVFDGKGFVFFTNLESKKGQELAAHPKAGLNFLWKTLGRQIRIDGSVEKVSDEEADSYFQSRPRGSQIGAWASKQSRPLESRKILEGRVEKFTENFDGKEVPRPAFWSGYRVIPRRIEFWEAREFRLHDRFEFLWDEEEKDWIKTRLYP